MFLVGADDDSFWEAGKYIRRMDQRLKERPHVCQFVPLVYEHGTHFVLPESLLRMALPVGLKFVLRFIFRAAKEYPDAVSYTHLVLIPGAKKMAMRGANIIRQKDT